MRLELAVLTRSSLRECCGAAHQVLMGEIDPELPFGKDL